MKPKTPDTFTPQPIATEREGHTPTPAAVRLAKARLSAAAVRLRAGDTTAGPEADSAMAAVLKFALRQLLRGSR